jgi:hypothetical protein
MEECESTWKGARKGESLGKEARMEKTELR